MRSIAPSITGLVIAMVWRQTLSLSPILLADQWAHRDRQAQRVPQVQLGQLGHKDFQAQLVQQDHKGHKGLKGPELLCRLLTTTLHNKILARLSICQVTRMWSRGT
jgi:hypothetical protein